MRHHQLFLTHLIKGLMTLQTRQFQYEHDTWKRVLYHMMDENAHFKIRLSEVLRSRSDKKFIDKAEQFQSMFVKFDEQIVMLRSQLAVLNKKIKSDPMHGGIIDSKLDFETLRKNMISAERQLIRSRMNFMNYLVKLHNIDIKSEIGPGLNTDNISFSNTEYDKQMWLAIA